MKRKKPRAYRMRINIQNAETTTAWKDSTITLLEFRNGEKYKVVHVVIDRPGTLSFMRDQLDKIEREWRAELERLKPVPPGGF